MSAPEDSLPESPPDQQTPRRCRVRYRVRWFSSKGAFLILLWTFLVSFSYYGNPWGKMLKSINILFNGSGIIGIFLNFTVVIVSAIPSGWLAGALLGHYRIVKTGSVSLLIILIIDSAIDKILDPLELVDLQILSTLLLVFGLLGLASITAILVNLFQLGLEQMPDASSNNIKSYISWFVMSLSGAYFFTVIGDIFKNSYTEVWSLLPVLCVSIVLCSDFLLTPKWLIKEPKSPHSLKVIYRVLRYAKKHKSPVNRSALTYWEEDLPSRIDLGKSKYGGPFSTEQVENVKTLLRISAVSIPMWIIFMTLSNYTVDVEVSTNRTHPLPIFTRAAGNVYNGVPFWILIYEFIVYPFFPDLPSTLKRIGAVSFMIVIINIVYMILSILNYYEYSGIVSMGVPYIVLEGLIGGLMIAALEPAVLEFVCAQSPHNMRGLLNGYMFLIIIISPLIGTIMAEVFESMCPQIGGYCTVIYTSFLTALSLVGLVSHILLSHWYKRRKREDIIATQQWVEEVYDRYLSTKP